MANDIWFFSDPHFDHANFLKFKDDEGNFCRAFDTVKSMNETMIQNYIALVKPHDKVYWMGDVTLRPNSLARIMCRLPGHKRLIGGNHDDLKNYELTRWFEKVGIWRIFKEHNIVVSHIPMHHDCFRHKVQYNVHGHTHQRHIMIGNGPNYRRDPRYENVSCELTSYGPIHLDEVKARLRPL